MNRNAVFFAAGVITTFTLFMIPKWFQMISNIHKKSGKRKRIVFFGDSITQQAQDPINDGWISCLGNWWTRRVDVINRGFSGYNTKYAVLIVQRAVIRERPDLVVVFFGANDAAIPQSTQHVPLEEYHLNLLFIIAEIKQSYPNVPLLLVTPPPVWETAVEERNRGYGNAIALDRTNERAHAYGLRCLDIGRKVGIPVIDLWTEMEGSSESREEYLSDGLHLTARGNRKVFELIKKAVLKHYPDFNPETMPMDMPESNQINFANPQESFQF